jgi:uroporphyrinogen III methyltransferase / synthase
MINSDFSDTNDNLGGKAYLVGAGVGGLSHLTQRAKEVLGIAEVLIYDALVDSSILSLVPIDCDRVFVGKRGGQPSFNQSEIDKLLVKYVSQGKQVVRLKSGDPLIFGRAISELKALHESNCDSELVPGISSAIAAPLFAGIPLTDANVSSCFVVLSAHDLAILPWQALNQLPTLVILMGTANLEALIELLKGGKSNQTAIAIIQWCGTAQQQIWTGTLENIRSKLPQHSISPAVIVVGQVVEHSEWILPHVSSQLSLPQTLPLANRTILVTRAAGQSSNFSQILQKLGATTIEMPTLEILPPKSWLTLDRAIADLNTYDWLILTSANGVESFFKRLNYANKDSRALSSLKIAVVGEKTADSLRNFGILADLIPPKFIADSLVESFSELFFDLKDKRILFPQVESGGREITIEQLSNQGAIVDAIAAYESGCPAQIDPQALAAIQAQTLDFISFTSAKTVKHFCKLLDRVADRETWQAWISNAKIASIGTQTSIACNQLLGRVDCEAEIFTLDGLAQAIALSMTL